MTSFADHVDGYLRLRRSFGFKLEEHERLLRKFATHMDDLGAETVTVPRGPLREILAAASAPNVSR